MFSDFSEVTGSESPNEVKNVGKRISKSASINFAVPPMLISEVLESLKTKSARNEFSSSLDLFVKSGFKSESLCLLS